MQCLSKIGNNKIKLTFKTSKLAYFMRYNDDISTTEVKPAMPSYNKPTCPGQFLIIVLVTRNIMESRNRK